MLEIANHVDKVCFGLLCHRMDLVIHPFLGTWS